MLSFKRAADRATQASSSFTSYAQNFEDVILNRVFPGDRGFYIDVGAQHPVRDSVTCAFYARGWHGLNIDASPQYFKKLLAHRPRDTNEQCAVGDHDGSITFFEIPGTGLSTSNPDYMQRDTHAGLRRIERIVPCKTLDRLCEEHAIGKVDFLKIDVEGAEAAVLKGFAFDKIRPIVLVIEATEPCSPVPSYGAWEPRLLSLGYEMVYDDRLNRFYLAKERSELKKHFAYPPNVFDQYRRPIRMSDVAKQLLSPPVRMAVRAARRLAALSKRHAALAPKR